MKIEIKDGDSTTTINGNEVIVYGPNGGTKPIALVKELSGDWLVSTARDEKFNEFIQSVGGEAYNVETLEIDQKLPEYVNKIDELQGV